MKLWRMRKSDRIGVLFFVLLILFFFVPTPWNYPFLALAVGSIPWVLEAKDERDY